MKVLGRGTIVYDGPQDPNGDTGWLQQPDWHCIVANQAHNVEIDGLTCIIRSRTWSIQMKDSTGFRFDDLRVIGGDLDRGAVRLTEVNLRPVGRAHLACWDATRLPLADGSIDAIACNPPFGVQLGEPEEMGPLYRKTLREYDRVLRQAGKAVLLVADQAAKAGALLG